MTWPCICRILRLIRLCNRGVTVVLTFDTSHLLLDPRLPSSLDQNVPQYKRDFRRKLIYFRSQPALRPVPGQCHVKVRRSHIFEDSYHEIMRQSPTDLKKRLMIKFEGEDGLDYGGLSR